MSRHTKNTRLSFAVLLIILVAIGVWLYLRQSTSVFTQTPSLTFVGSGDIARGRTDAEKTAKLLDQVVAQDPNTIVYTTGDNAYADGTLAQFNENYHPTWGRHRSRTRPTAGNHDHHTTGAQGHLDYFCPNANDCVFPGGTQKLYYSYNAGGWHFIALDSDISMSATSEQVTWLKADLAANPSQCILAYWHHPRFSSSSNHGSDTTSSAVWTELIKAKADIVLNGHDHTYERFALQNANGQPDPQGIREFVVGTGGAALYEFGDPEPNSVVRYNDSHGVLKFNLRPDSYDWHFMSVAGHTFTDTGSGTCKNGDPDPTPGPSLTIAPTAQPTIPGGCPKKPQGDADCNGSVSIADYAIWKGEFKGTTTTKTADFNSDGKISLVDYQIWRKTFTGGGPVTPTTPIAEAENSLCLVRSGPKSVISGLQTARLDASVANGTNIDARTATWRSATAGNYPVLFRFDATKNQDICWYGGSIKGEYAVSTTWEQFHDTTAFLVRSPRFRVESVFIERYGDGIGFTEGGSDWTISDVKMTDVRDDCVENDYKYNGAIDDSLLDGCYVGFSSRGHSGQTEQIDGRNNTFTITNTLVRLLPVTSVFKGASPGHGPFFKWSENPTEGYGNKLVIRNSIFRADQVPNHGHLGLPSFETSSGTKTPYQVECSNNTMVWLGPGAFPEQLPSCFTVTKDKSVWDNAVAAWNARHPNLGK